MPPKKKRPLRKSYAGVAPSVSKRTAKKAQPSKKKRTTCEAVLNRAWATIADLEAELADVTGRLKLTERAYDAEVAFWKKEVEHLQQRAVDAVLDAVKK